MKAGPERSQIPLGPHHIVKKFQSTDPNFRLVVINGGDIIPVFVLVRVWFLSLYWEPDNRSTAKTSCPAESCLPSTATEWVVKHQVFQETGPELSFRTVCSKSGQLYSTCPKPNWVSWITGKPFLILSPDHHLALWNIPAPCIFLSGFWVWINGFNDHSRGQFLQGTSLTLPGYVTLGRPLHHIPISVLHDVGG